MKKALLCLILLVAASCSSGKKDPLNVHEYTLDNGLKVFLTVNKEKPVIYSEIVVKAGGKNDPSYSTGIAHYLEHMLFKGSEDFGTTDFKKEKPHLDEITRLYEVYEKTKDPAKRKAIYKKIDEASQKASKFAIANEYDKMYQAIGGTGSNAYTSNDKTVYIGSIPLKSLSWSWKKYWKVKNLLNPKEQQSLSGQDDFLLSVCCILIFLSKQN